MSSRSRTISLPPAAVLALSVLLCGGGFAEPATAALLLQHAEEVSTSAAASEWHRGMNRTAGREQRKAVASLLSCLTDAARQLQKLQDGPDAPAMHVPDVGRACGLHTALPVSPASGLTLHPLSRALPQHLNLPPPGGSL